MRRVPALVAVALCVAASALAAERTFHLRHRQAGAAAGVVVPLLSSDGTVLVEPKTNAVTVRDRDEVIDRIERALAAWDRPPASYRVRLLVLLASTATGAGPQPKAVEELGVDLRELFHFTSFEEIDSLSLVAKDGSSVETPAGGRYTVRFRLRSSAEAPDRVQLAPLELFRGDTRAASSSLDTLRPLLRSTVSLRVGQTSVVAAARSERADQALLVVISAAREVGP
ncbi:MAG: secretin N-terminal domain-containing protein [Acidobacteriota bacterium]